MHGRGHSVLWVGFASTAAACRLQLPVAAAADKTMDGSGYTCDSAAVLLFWSMVAG